MAKFSNTKTKTRRPVAATRVTSTPALTHEGGTGYTKDDKTALFTLAVTNMVGEPTFYESGKDRDDRFRTLITKVTAEDPAWIAGFIGFLRNEANMRSASIVVAAEASLTLLGLRAKGVEIDGNIRSMIDSACVRADEPAEMLGYWLANYGRAIPMGVKRGVGDAAKRLYTERNILKYDGVSRGLRMGDVLNLTHPTSKVDNPAFTYLLDRRHGHLDSIPESLTMIMAATDLDTTPEDQRRAVLRERGPEALAEAGYTWERLSGWLPGGMDAEAWEAIIPSMGYMALLRNLRNFEQAKVSKAVLKGVADRLADPDEVARSRQFPYRFFSAWKASGSTFFGAALEAALDESVKNIPEFSGKTLVAIDTSGSMQSPVSGRSQAECYEVGALFGSAVASRSDCDVILYADTWAHFSTEVSVLRSVEKVRNQIGKVGYGTNTWPSVAQAFAKRGGYDRIVVMTDMQDHPNAVGGGIGYSRHNSGIVLPDVPIYVWDLRGYQTSNIDNSPGRYLFAGFSDAAFKMIALLERGRDAGWPWE
jgi:hypothetical protein